MTKEQRKGIDNGIWLCQTHSRLIDADEAAYSTSRLHAMKAEHEARIQHEMSNMQAYPEPSDFIALGPDIAFLGELVAVEAQAWTFRVDHFVIGDPGVLIQYIEKFETLDPYDKYVLSNELGDGRQLSLAPSWSKSESGLIIKTHIISSHPRISADRLPGDIALTADHDILISNGQIEIISGLKALPQRIKTCLSMIRGESPFWPKYGSRIQEYIAEFYDTPWFPRLIKLETIRMATIPYSVDIGRSNFTTPLHCVRRVLSVDQVDSGDGKGWMKFRFCLDVEGIGEWIQEIPIFVSQ